MPHHASLWLSCTALFSSSTLKEVSPCLYYLIHYQAFLMPSVFTRPLDTITISSLVQLVFCSYILRTLFPLSFLSFQHDHLLVFLVEVGVFT